MPKKTRDINTVNTNELAAAIGYERQTLNRLAKEGILHKHGRGTWILKDVISDLIKWEIEKATKPLHEKIEALGRSDPEKKYKYAAAQLKEIELEKLRGNLVERETIKNLYLNDIENLRKIADNEIHYCEGAFIKVVNKTNVRRVWKNAINSIFRKWSESDNPARDTAENAAGNHHRAA